MKKVIKTKRGTVSKADSTQMIEEEFFARVDKAKEEIKQGEGIRFSDSVAMTEWLNSI